MGFLEKRLEELGEKMARELLTKEQQEARREHIKKANARKLRQERILKGEYNVIDLEMERQIRL